jgi:hypothetical protein
VSWGTQFERSWHGRDPDETSSKVSYSDFDLTLPSEPIEQYAAEYFTFNGEQTDSQRIALAAVIPLLAGAWRKLHRDIEEVWPHEWPTETAMFFALLILARDHFDGVSFERGTLGPAGDLETGLENLSAPSWNYMGVSSA